MRPVSRSALRLAPPPPVTVAQAEAVQRSRAEAMEKFQDHGQVLTARFLRN